MTLFTLNWWFFYCLLLTYTYKSLVSVYSNKSNSSCNISLYCTYISVYYFRPVKWYLMMNVGFKRQNTNGGMDHTSLYLQFPPVVQLNHINTVDNNQESLSQLNDLVDAYMDQRSGWTIEKIRNVSLNLATYDNIVGTSYFKSPQWLINRKCTVNIKNDDEVCFVY